MTMRDSWRSSVARMLLSLVLLSAGIAGFVVLGRSRPLPTQTAAIVRPQVEIVRAERHREGIHFSVDGEVAPFRELKIAAEATGRIVFKADNCRVGRIVRRGERLMQVDPRDYQYAVDRLREELAEADNKIVELDVQIDSAEKQLQLAEEDVVIQNRFVARLERLAKSNATSQNDVDTAKRNELNSRIALQTQRDQWHLYLARKRGLESAQRRMLTQLRRAEIELERTDVISPIDGVITEEHAERDSYVQEGTTVFVIRDGSRLDVRCSLQTNEMHWLWAAGEYHGEGESAAAFDFPETPVRVVYKVGDERFAWDGVLARYDGGGVDKQTRMIPCRVHVLAPERVTRLDPTAEQTMASPPTLMVGMFVEVQVHVEPRSRLLRLPAAALRPANRIWIVDNGQLAPRTVEVAAVRNDVVLVYEQEGVLSEGERVVVSPLASPELATEVQVREES